MDKIKKGDIVTRKSYNDDVNFLVENIVKDEYDNKIAILKGITLRIEVASSMDDLVIVDKHAVDKELERFEKNIDNRTDEILEKYGFEGDENSRSFLVKNDGGTILHLDGDKKYAEKSLKVYNKLNLKSVVKNIKESKQPFEITNLLNKYQPDIVVLTGHDGMIKRGRDYNNILNYRNSKYFVRTVEEIRRWEGGRQKIAIFAGACQSFYEAIMDAGANFASSPARILIDFMDPLIIAEKLALTPRNTFVSIADVRKNLRNGEKGVSGIGSFGKNRN